MVALFHDMIHHEIEVYVDDMIAKSQTEEEHLDHRSFAWTDPKRLEISLSSSA